MKNLELSGSSIKILAIVLMLIDHIGAILLPQFYIFRQIGRIAFPLFIFLLVEGYIHTRDVKKYAMRLLLFAVISEIPFDLAFRSRFIFMGYQNIFFTLFLGLVGIYAIEYFRYTKPFYMIGSVIGVCAFAEFFHTDYGYVGVLAILSMYLLRENKIAQMAVTTFVLCGVGVIEVHSVLAFLILYFYNGKRGNQLKYVFYAFYPIHLCVLWMISKCLF